jgi:hypothetical protein
MAAISYQLSAVSKAGSYQLSAISHQQSVRTAELTADR